MRDYALAQTQSIIVCDNNQHNRRLVADVLIGGGFEKCHFANDGEELLKATEELSPKVVITASRLPKVSGLEYTRIIRSGHKDVNRTLSIIVMTNTPTKGFIEAARVSGVDEMLACPFSADGLFRRIEAVIIRPRRFVDSARYVGPCRRRRMVQDYSGPMRRFSDPIEEDIAAPWEAESNRELVRFGVQKISELATGLTPGDRRKLREIYAAVQEAEQLADEVRDDALAGAVKSLGRYITGMGASSDLDTEVISTHIDALQQLGILKAEHGVERQLLIDGLVKVVDKKLGRTARDK
jgi:CheY-like chemotaxis protein